MSDLSKQVGFALGTSDVNDWLDEDCYALAFKDFVDEIKQLDIPWTNEKIQYYQEYIDESIKVWIVHRYGVKSGFNRLNLIRHGVPDDFYLTLEMFSDMSQQYILELENEIGMLGIFAMLALRFARACEHYPAWFYIKPIIQAHARQDGGEYFYKTNKTAIEQYEKNSRILAEARKISAENRRCEKDEREAWWREKAEKKWPIVPGWTVGEMAEWIKDHTGTRAAIGTIKNAIKGVKAKVFQKKS